MPIVAPNRYPSLQGMMDLFRSLVNDDGSGQDGPQGGIIATNTAPFALVFLNSAIRDLYSDLRNVGDPELIVDNYLVLGLPALTGPDPAVQVSLGFLGYFDGFLNHGNWTLPAGAMGIDQVWERQAGSGGNFFPLTPQPAGLAPIPQGAYMRRYEWRGNALWMPGAVQSVDLRIRCKIALPDFQGTALNFATTYVPLLNCTNAVVDKMLVLYARRFAPDQLPIASASAAASLGRMQTEIVRQMQGQENRRADFGEAAVGSFNGWMTDL